eukprot:scaffold8346_cov119-Isochrysis_galbana.AAC.2
MAATLALYETACTWARGARLPESLAAVDTDLKAARLGLGQARNKMRDGTSLVGGGRLNAAAPKEPGNTIPEADEWFAGAEATARS